MNGGGVSAFGSQQPHIAKNYVLGMSWLPYPADRQFADRRAIEVACTLFIKFFPAESRHKYFVLVNFCCALLLAQRHVVDFSGTKFPVMERKSIDGSTVWL